MRPNTQSASRPKRDQQTDALGHLVLGKQEAAEGGQGKEREGQQVENLRICSQGAMRDPSARLTNAYISIHSWAACTSPNPASGRRALRTRWSEERPPSRATRRPMLKNARP